MKFVVRVAWEMYCVLLFLRSTYMHNVFRLENNNKAFELQRKLNTKRGSIIESEHNKKKSAL